jgi:hypothetical protein
MLFLERSIATRSDLRTPVDSIRTPETGESACAGCKEKQMLRCAQHDRYPGFHPYWWTEGHVALAGSSPRAGSKFVRY